MIKRYNDLIKESKGEELVDGGYYWVKLTSPLSDKSWTVGQYTKCEDDDDLCWDIVGSDEGYRASEIHVGEYIGKK